MSRSNFYNGRGLTIPQIQIAESLDEQTFSRWVEMGMPISKLNEIIEAERVKNSKGQTPPSSVAGAVKVKGQMPTELGGGKIGEYGLVLRPDRMPNEIDSQYADAALQKFMSAYQQFVPSQSNAQKIIDFLGSRGAKVTFKNLVIAFERLFGQLELRTIVKEVEEPTTKINKRGKSVAIDPFFFPKPVKASLIEIILDPSDVRSLSADQTAQFMKPMQFAEVTESATEYVNSEEFRSETPEPRSRSAREQSEAQILREAKIFLVSNPQYERYFGDLEHFGDLYRLILGKIEDWNLQINEQSFADAFRWAESEGIIPKVDTAVHGQLTTAKITPDARRHWTKSEIANEIRHMSSTDFQARLNSDPDFRRAVDSSQ